MKEGGGVRAPPPLPLPARRPVAHLPDTRAAAACTPWVFSEAAGDVVCKISIALLAPFRLIRSEMF